MSPAGVVTPYARQLDLNFVVKFRCHGGLGSRARTTHPVVLHGNLVHVRVNWNDLALRQRTCVSSKREDKKKPWVPYQDSSTERNQPLSVLHQQT